MAVNFDTPKVSFCACTDTVSARAKIVSIFFIGFLFIVLQ